MRRVLFGIVVAAISVCVATSAYAPPPTPTPPSVSAMPIPGSPAYPNLVLNPGFDIDQVNEGAAVSGAIYVVDSWAFLGQTVASGVTAQRSTDAPPGNAHSVIVTIGTGSATINATDQVKLIARMTGDQITSTGFGTAGASTLMLCWQAKSSIAATYGVSLGMLPVNSRNYVILSTLAAPNVWQKFCQQIPGDVAGAWDLSSSNAALRVQFALEVGSNFITNTPFTWVSTNSMSTSAQTQLSTTTGATFQIAEVKLELAPYPTPFVRREPAVELALLHRFYAKSYDIGVAPGTVSNFRGAAETQTTTSTQIVGDISLPTKMRCVPTIVLYSPQSGATGKAYDLVNAADVSATSMNIGQSGFSWQASPSAGTNSNLAVQWTADCRL